MQRKPNAVKGTVTAAVLLAFLVVPIALASDGGPEAIPSGANKKIRKLTQRVAALEAALAGLGGQVEGITNQVQGSSGGVPPGGPAGGALSGTYPNPEIAPGAVGSAQVAAGSLTGDDVLNNSLGGADIDESALGQVPNAATATNATNAGNVNGLQVRAFHYAANANSGNQTFLSLGGLAIVASCDAAGNIQLVATPQTNDSYIRSSNGQSDPDFDISQEIDLDTPDTDGARFLALRRGPAAAGSTTFDSNSVSAIVVFDSNPAVGPACQASGTAMGRP